MNNDTVRQLEASIQRNKEHVALDQALQRLLNNRDFVTVIKDGYFKEEAVRLVSLKADPSMQTPEKQASIVAQIDAIGGLQSYFRTVGFNASMAFKQIETDEAMREELTAEAL